MMIDRFLAWVRRMVTPATMTTDLDCTDCYGLGYDGSGAVCRCVRVVHSH
jgi:hypothetical protein